MNKTEAKMYRKAATSFIFDMQQLENEAYRLALVETAQFLNKAKNSAGWQIAKWEEKLKNDQS